MSRVNINEVVALLNTYYPEDLSRLRGRYPQHGGSLEPGIIAGDGHEEAGEPHEARAAACIHTLKRIIERGEERVQWARMRLRSAERWEIISEAVTALAGLLTLILKTEGLLSGGPAQSLALSLLLVFIVLSSAVGLGARLHKRGPGGFAGGQLEYCRQVTACVVQAHEHLEGFAFWKKDAPVEQLEELFRRTNEVAARSQDVLFEDRLRPDFHWVRKLGEGARYSPVAEERPSYP